MFEIGEYVVYGTRGVCQVEKIGEVNMGEKGKLYYTLIPVYQFGSRIFTPVDSNKVIMRTVISKKEAMKLIDDIENIETIWIIDEKTRELTYKEAVRKCDCRELVKIIKTLYVRKMFRIAEGKKVTANDEKYLKIAEDSLYGELAFPLEMDKNKVESFIIEQVRRSNKSNI